MNLRVVQSRRTSQDLTEHFAFIAHDNVNAALRFLEAYDKATRTLSQFPEIGSRRILLSSRAQNVWLWTIEGFENYAIIYQVRKDSIYVLRVLHAAQDYTKL